MSIQTRTDKEVAQLVGTDAQGELVMKITTLAYKINQAEIAEVFIKHQPHSLHVVVKAHLFGSPEKLNEVCGLAIKPPAGVIDALLLSRLRKLLASLEQIFKDGAAPRDGAV